MIDPFEETEDMCDYERQRMQNIKDIYLSYGDLMVGVKVSSEDLLQSVSSSKTKEASVNGRKCHRSCSQNWQRVKLGTKCTTLDDNGNPPACIKRSARLRNVERKTSDYIENSDSDDDNGSRKKKPRQGSLRLKFPWYKNKENVERDRTYYGCLDDNDFVVSDEDEANYNDHVSRSKRKRGSEVSTARLPVSQVTPKMLDNIMYYSAGKEYSSDGTTCHQCRQKTTDQKSYCRYKGCIGVRGMFCGFCLGKRYGEDVAEVLLNPKWACPVCRGYCNYTT